MPNQQQPHPVWIAVTWRIDVGSAASGVASGQRCVWSGKWAALCMAGDLLHNVVLTSALRVFLSSTTYIQPQSNNS